MFLLCTALAATTLNHSTHKPNMAVKRRQLCVIAVHSCWCFLPKLPFSGPGSFASAGTNSNSEGSRTQPRHVDQPVLFVSCIPLICEPSACPFFLAALRRLCFAAPSSFTRLAAVVAVPCEQIASLRAGSATGPIRSAQRRTLWGDRPRSHPRCGGRSDRPQTLET